MSRHVICDLCEGKFPLYYEGIDDEYIDDHPEDQCWPIGGDNDVCAKCCEKVVHNMVELCGFTFEQVKEFYEAKAGANNVVSGLLSGLAGALFDTPAEAPKKKVPEPPLAFGTTNPDDHYLLVMEGAGLPPDSKFYFPTLEKVKDYAARNAEVFPDAAYRVLCPNGDLLVGEVKPPDKGNTRHHLSWFLHEA